MSLSLSTINLPKWLEENSHLLRPPVNNFCLYRDGFTIMVVGGPNARTDYHINPTPEWFYQHKGHMTLKIVDTTDSDKFKEITINEGDMYLLPPNVPHNPVRYADTVGIVVEQERPKGMDDRLRWYCRGCGEVVSETVFYCTDLGTQVKSAIERFEGDMERRKCKKCGVVAETR